MKTEFPAKMYGFFFFQGRQKFKIQSRLLLLPHNVHNSNQFVNLEDCVCCIEVLIKLLPVLYHAFVLCLPSYVLILHGDIELCMTMNVLSFIFLTVVCVLFSKIAM